MKSREKKIEQLKGLIKRLGSVAVAYSGGVDSTFLLKACRDVLADRVIAVTGLSETYQKREAERAAQLAREIGVRHLMIPTRELRDPRFAGNPAQRCYFCKKELFGRLSRLARRNRCRWVVDGSNVDDLSDYRPGVRAKEEYGVVSPLQQAGLTKKDIRIMSRRWGLSTWDKPAMACLASRIPYGEKISAGRLRRIERAEEMLRKAFGIRGNLRVRDFGTRARVEVDKGQIGRLPSRRLKKLLGSVGYKEVSIDPRGYRTGSMNEALKT